VRGLLGIAALGAAVLSAGALAAEGDPQKRHTPADTTKARSIVLKRADLGPGWKRDTSPDTDDDLGCAYYDPDESDLVETGNAEGNFETQIAFVGSEVSIYRTVADAQAAWRRGAKPELARCFAELLVRELRKDFSAVRTVRAGVMAFPRVAPKTMAWKIVVRVTQSGRVLPLNVDAIALGRGRIVTLLAAIQFGSPPSAAAERQLAALLARRMR
jgi:hypothetical protein